jgi:hypothetical protein
MTPQYIYINELGSKFYYKDYEMKIIHREDGPAVEWSDRDKLWYLNGVKYTEEEYKNKTVKEIVLTMDQIAAKFDIDIKLLKIAK